MGTNDHEGLVRHMNTNKQHVTSACLAARVNTDLRKILDFTHYFYAK